MVPEVSSSTTTMPPLSPTSSEADGLNSAAGSFSHASDVTAPI